MSGIFRVEEGVRWVWCTQDPKPSGGAHPPHFKSSTGKIVRIFPTNNPHHWLVMDENGEIRNSLVGPHAEQTAFSIGKTYTL